MAKEKTKDQADDGAVAEAPSGKGKPERAKAPKGDKPAGDDAATAGKAAGEGAKPAAPKKPKKEASASAPGGEERRKQKRGHPPRKQSKRFRKAMELKPAEALEVPAAVKVLKQMAAGVKFNQTVNVVLWLGIDPKQADQAIRGAVSLPRGIGKTLKVICFAEGEEADKAREAGAIEAGADDLIKKISDGWQEFDVAVAHPRLMGKVGKLGRVLGPSGKMPSPKNGTVTADIATAVREFTAGKVEFRNDTSGNVHAIVGKIQFPDDDLAANIEAFVDHIRRMKPQSSKGVYLKKVCISASMSPSIELKVAS